mmetsp:Transcript_3219/g.10742  ORF Transcript_3219/g.10742 Transcript_3219/m.10742 type:complete len:313 (+) Transcript_3219:663-1601(+)
MPKTDWASRSLPKTAEEGLRVSATLPLSITARCTSGPALNMASTARSSRPFSRMKSCTSVCEARIECPTCREVLPEPPPPLLPPPQPEEPPPPPPPPPPWKAAGPEPQPPGEPIAGLLGETGVKPSICPASRRRPRTAADGFRASLTVPRPRTCCWWSGRASRKACDARSSSPLSLMNASMAFFVGGTVPAPTTAAAPTREVEGAGAGPLGPRTPDQLPPRAPTLPPKPPPLPPPPEGGPRLGHQLPPPPPPIQSSRRAQGPPSPDGSTDGKASRQSALRQAARPPSPLRAAAASKLTTTGGLLPPTPTTSP